jgi:hypothetical protein
MIAVLFRRSGRRGKKLWADVRSTFCLVPEGRVLGVGRVEDGPSRRRAEASHRSDPLSSLVVGHSVGFS